MKKRLDKALVEKGMVATRSQAESYIKLGMVEVEGRSQTKPGFLVSDDSLIKLTATEQYVSRAGLKLASVAEALHLDFKSKVVLDIGSSTGGFTDYALKHGAKLVLAVEVGTDQLHASLQGHPDIELREKTDIREFQTDRNIDIAVADVSFISLRDILPSVLKLCNAQTKIVAMVKPQFEAHKSSLKHKGVIKNDKMRRQILQDFEGWARQYFVIIDKADSQVSGSKGNQERFYLLKPILKA
jgi:23S rRNA (cytidine1920-2'-O)/16S rRNA (cytidine1409-2'-O)-methyltransferase